MEVRARFQLFRFWNVGPISCGGNLYSLGSQRIPSNKHAFCLHMANRPRLSLLVPRIEVTKKNRPATCHVITRDSVMSPSLLLYHLHDTQAQGRIGFLQTKRIQENLNKNVSKSGGSAAPDCSKYLLVAETLLTRRWPTWRRLLSCSETVRKELSGRLVQLPALTAWLSSNHQEDADNTDSPLSTSHYFAPSAVWKSLVKSRVPSAAAWS